MSDRAWTVDDHLRGCDPDVIRLYEGFVDLVKACGPFELSVSKTAITLKGSRRGFAGAKPKSRWLDGYLDLQRQVKDSRIRTASPYTKRLFVHQFRVTALDQLDEEFAAWVREAYEVGEGRHLDPGGGATSDSMAQLIGDIDDEAGDIDEVVHDA